MMSNANGAMYGNIQGIKNLMKSYDKDGDYIDPTTGLAGLLVTEENASGVRLFDDSNDGTEEMEDLEDDIQVIENDDEQLPEKKGKWSIVLLSLPLIAAAVWLFCFNRIKKKRKMKKMRLF